LITDEDTQTKIDSAIALSRNYLSGRGDLEEAEYFLLSVAGLQSTSHGFIVELNLGEIYFEMKEYPRARRFLEVARSSAQEPVSQKASEVLALIKKANLLP
jgi:hypothetical protein